MIDFNRDYYPQGPYPIDIGPLAACWESAVTDKCIMVGEPVEITVQYDPDPVFRMDNCRVCARPVAVDTFYEGPIVCSDCCGEGNAL